MSPARSTSAQSPRDVRQPAGRHRHRTAVRAGSGIAALIGATTLLLLGAPGNAVSADRSDVAPSGVTFAAGGPRSDTIFDLNARPESTTRRLDASIEVGLRFVPRVDGSIAGIRVYRPDGETGNQSATIWTDSGASLAYIGLPPTSGAGWLYVDLGKPVQVQRNEEYVVSYHTAYGYVADEGYFSSAVVTPGGLVHPALAGDQVDRRNGVFRYSNRNVFPYRTHQSTNYWVDVAFVAGYHPATTTGFSSPTPSCPLSCTPPTSTSPTITPSSTITCLVTCPPCPHTCNPPTPTTPTLTPTSQPLTLPPDPHR